MALVVHKYGGTSVKSIERIEAVAEHIAACRAAGDRAVVTISAMGAQTDELTALAQEITPDPPRRELDMLLTAGERVSMALLSIALHKRQVGAISLTGSQSGILTDETHGNARISQILGDRIRAGLADEKVVIVGGFQGVSPKTKEVTTLGRGGSDLTAVALAGALAADTCHLYKDVEGIYSADPRVVKNAKFLHSIDRESLAEMAWLGAQVLHPRCIHVARKFKVPLVIRSSYNLEHPGTEVGDPMESAHIAAITAKHDVTLLNVKFPGNEATGAIAAGLKLLWDMGVSPLVSQQVQTDGSAQWLLAITKECTPGFVAKFTAEQGLASTHVTTSDQDLSCVSIVGAGFQQSPEILEAIAEVVPAPHLLTHRDTAVSICVPRSQADQTVERLHAALLES